MSATDLSTAPTAKQKTFIQKHSELILRTLVPICVVPPLAVAA